MIGAGMGRGQTGSGDPGRGSECPVLVVETGDTVLGHVTCQYKVHGTVHNMYRPVPWVWVSHGRYGPGPVP